MSLDVLLFSGPAVKVEVSGHFAVLAAHAAGGASGRRRGRPIGSHICILIRDRELCPRVAVNGDYAYLADGQGLKVFRAFDSSVPVKRRTLGGIKSLFERPAKH